MSLKKLSDEEARELEDALSQSGIAFESLEEAEQYFFDQRDTDLAEIKTFGEKHPEMKLDFKAQSLLRLEDFYFKAYIDKTVEPDITKERFEDLLTQYMRQVFVANEMAEWMVFENEFAEGRYDLGLMYGYGSGATENYAYYLDTTEKEANRRYLYDKFMMYVPAEREKEVQ